MSSSAARISTMLEWSVRVQCGEHEIGGSLTVYIFLSNELPPNPDEWLFDPTFAGTFDVFSYERTGEQLSSTEHATNIVKGFIHINQKLLEMSRQKSLEPHVVVPFLKHHISWGVRKASSYEFYRNQLSDFSPIQVNGEVVELERFTSLEVTVLCTPLELPIGADYPIEGEPTVYPEITRGRVGGDRSTA